MKKLINAPGAVVPEMMEGLVALYPGLARVSAQPVLVRSDIAQVRDRVALISGGGSGHEPAHAGYVGDGMLSAAVLGDVFTSPSTDAVVAALRATAGTAGALLIVKNYTGDRLNFGLAAEVLRSEGVPVEMVVVADDVALAASGDHAGRRGLAGTVLVHKIAGAAARAGLKLAEVAARARAAAAAVRTMGVALSACTVPAVGRPGFELGAGEIELGLGIHGEPGVRRGPVQPVDELVDHLLDAILKDLEARSGERVVLMVNNLGGTPAMELTLVARRALQVLKARGLAVARTYAGTFLSALEMAGVSLTVMRVDDAALDALDAATSAPAWPAAASVSRPRANEAAVIEQAAAAEVPDESGGGDALRAAITRVIDAVLAAAPRLTELDQAVGDGDMGISLARGAHAMKDALPGLPLRSPGRTLRAIGLLLQRVMGGTSGPLYSAFLLRAGQRLSDHPDAAEWASALEAGCQAIGELGGAAAGDRTMLDALLPAAAAARAGLRQAADAAAEGARATASMRPRRGRSSYLGDRALGHVDPGAEAVAVWLRALAG